jgi:alkanesulfonate monooxygenase SsuD/methylene tetrahydromethanopterin reductase-like flavin-dependent oxidoreductase (luciferase family)
VRHGRKPDDILIFALMTVIVGRTDEEARAKFDEYRSYINHEGALTLFSGWTGIDFSQYSLDDSVKYIRNEAVHSAVDAFTVADPDKTWTVREVAEFVGIGGIGPIVVGSPKSVAEQLVSWVDATDLDGFNLAYAVTPETFSDIVELLIPELQRRGIFKKEYRPGTLREKFFGKGARLGETHPAHAYRHGTQVPA